MIVNEKKLNELLKRKGITKSALCNQLGISSRTIAKISKCEDINDNVVDKILKFLNASFEDLTDFNYILQRFYNEKIFHIDNGLLRDALIKFCYWENHINGNKLTEEQVDSYYSKHCLDGLYSLIPLNHLILVRNYFVCLNDVLDYTMTDLSLDIIDLFYKDLANGIQEAFNDDFNKEKVDKLKNIIQIYNTKKIPTLENILDLHCKIIELNIFGRCNETIARLVLFKECLKNNIIPFYIDDFNKDIYYRGISEWKTNKQPLLEASNLAQSNFVKLLNIHNVKYQ